MTVEGIVKNGVIVWDPSVSLPEGARVEIILPKVEVEESIATALLKLAGSATGLPSDFAAQHDHYIHGTPKR